MAYNLTFMENSTNILQSTQYVNDNSGFLFGTLMFFLIWIGIYLLFKREDAIEDFVGSSFLASIIGIMMILLDLITWQVAIIPIMATLLAFVVYSIK